MFLSISTALWSKISIGFIPCATLVTIPTLWYMTSQMHQRKSEICRGGLITNLYSENAKDLRIIRMIQKKFKITYTKDTTRGQILLSVEIEASSKYDAKSKFYKKHPTEEIVKVEEINNDNQQKKI